MEEGDREGSSVLPKQKYYTKIITLIIWLILLIEILSMIAVIKLYNYLWYI
jgi:hypothetical protein